jgi:hypothetical protein
MNSTTQTGGSWWHRHGTKILGAIAGLVGVAGESLSLIQTFDPKRAALWALVIGIAGGIVRRGFTNQAVIEQKMLAGGWTPPATGGPPPATGQGP